MLKLDGCGAVPFLGSTGVLDVRELTQHLPATNK